eukprot:CAMPEP_0194282140 /NCGR_PEP_ID=MMETSP0169-20130528/22468_1 /TAXON_ID=218684 /ORGANISM="Corethron pennatum, Strain L29A3" /LENGTH=368 /DNA_ID=CAMNT_0039027383 /DNA_START=318 /DNA_END=1421 /DNA_ORIENTATION=-
MSTGYESGGSISTQSTTSSSKKFAAFPVQNFVLVKHVKDNPDVEKGLLFIGTFIQHINDEDGILAGSFEGESMEGFPYRLNDEAGGDFTNVRRVQETACKNDSQTKKEVKTYKITYDVKAPLDIDHYFEGFPCGIMKARLSIELSALTSKCCESKLQPNLCIDTTNKSSNIAIQKNNLLLDTDKVLKKTYNKDGEIIIPKSGENKDLLEQIRNKMDRSNFYEFVTPIPKVTYILKGDNCSKLLIDFYFVESGVAKFVKVLSPMMLICWLNWFHVQTNKKQSERGDGAGREYLGNSAAFALTVVFLFESIIPKSRRERGFLTINSMYLMLVFTALILSSIPADFMAKEVGTVGALLFFASFLLPIYDYW